MDLYLNYNKKVVRCNDTQIIDVTGGIPIKILW
jgi:hypothetical protein